MRGRKPIPTSLHAIRGTLRPAVLRKRRGEPKAEGGLDAAPAWLSPGQRESWRYAIEHAPAGVLRKIDRGALAIWCEAENRHRIASVQQSKLDRDNSMPLLVKGPDGVATASPYIGILNKSAIILLKAAAELGFTPASRPRIAAGLGEAAAKPSAWAALHVIQGGKEPPDPAA